MCERLTVRYAVVTGANKGIGFEICRQLAANGVIVVLTARDEKRGTEAVEKLKDLGFSDNIVFHQLDVVDPASIASLAAFIKTQFGKLDILVNNAGIGGVISYADGFRACILGTESGAHTNWNDVMTQTYELAEECLKTNYYGAKGMIEALIPLLQLSDRARIVNVSSFLGKLKNIQNEWAKGVLNDDVKNLTEERVDEVLNEFLKDFKQASVGSKGRPTGFFAYVVSKAVMNAYTRVLANKYTTLCINCVCPGYVQTDINLNTGFLTIEEGAESPVRLALLPDGGPSGLFFSRKEVVPF